MKPSVYKFAAIAVAMVLSYVVGLQVEPNWSVEKTQLDVSLDEHGDKFYMFRGKPRHFHAVSIDESPLNPETFDSGAAPKVHESFVFDAGAPDGPQYSHLVAKRNWGIWSLLPALVAVALCWITREPITSLLSGIISGALILRLYDITGDVLIPSLATTGAASILVLYLWLLGGLMGLWSRSGAAQAFAEFMTVRFVRGPKSAKLVAWSLGVVFFQGGTVSTVLVGSTVKPIADAQKISHEELSYIVDSTASPIASQLAFNAWPGYVQAFIFVSGVSFLATEADRIAFFFSSVPFCFYAIFAVLGTFLLSIERPMFLGRGMRSAMVRSRTTGKLDDDDAEPLSAPELQGSNVPPGYRPHVAEFFVPLGLLIAIAIGTFVTTGAPNVLWAFGAAVLSASAMALCRGMSLKDLMAGYQEGLKGIVLGSVILLLAITIGGISSDVGAGTYLVEQLGSRIPWFVMPVLLQVLTMVISFSTGTSWGTYAVAFPLAMPLGWAVATAQGLEHPEFFLTLCFAAVMDGSVFGDQCSPISDTTVLSSMCTGSDLMDHVRTQIPQATFAAVIAAVLWTVLAWFCGP
ncbi:MAG: hypothetical protein J4F97_00935 [Pseudomonadales bacterium]|nr:hypothetical protein [Pseudomonadales bacterium]